MTDDKTNRMKDITMQHLPESLQSEYIDFIHAKFGLVIKMNNNVLTKSIIDACHKYEFTPEDYLMELKKADNNSEILTNLVATITIGETYFFRDRQQMKMLSETVLPKIIAKKIAENDYTLRIWSAGCSSGEEIYTMVMMINEMIDMNQSGKKWQCKFLATDINIELLRKGVSGKYSEWSMRSIPDAYVNKYFTKTNSTYLLSENIRQKVEFEYLNLNSDMYPSILSGTSSLDLVLCRNVLIYFDAEHVSTILNRLIKSISDDGFIMLGASDPASAMSKNMVAYRESPSLFIKRSASAVPVIDSQIFSEYHFESHTKPPEIIEVVTEVSKVNHEINDTKIQKNTDNMIKELLTECRWKEVIQLINEKKLISKLNSLDYHAKACAEANIGHTAEAIKTCEESLKFETMNQEIYFIYALSLSEMKMFKEAEVAFRNALYIDPDYLVCRYQFGVFLFHIKKNDEGMKSLNSALQSAKKFNENDLVSYHQKMTYKEFIQMLTSEIELHQ